MSYRDGLAAGIAARVMRISFSGERAYEVNVPANAGRAVWEALMAAGEEFGITPYGTETMHVLRAEKGYIIVGQDTDGSVTPQDLGMGGWWPRPRIAWASARWRARTRPPGRKQFVGLLTEDARACCRRGADHRARSARDAGRAHAHDRHVTSSYYSPILRRSIAWRWCGAAWTGWANASKCRWPMVAARSPSSPARFSRCPRGATACGVKRIWWRPPARRA